MEWDGVLNCLLEKCDSKWKERKVNSYWFDAYIWNNRKGDIVKELSTKIGVNYKTKSHHHLHLHLNYKMSDLDVELRNNCTHSFYSLSFLSIKPSSFLELLWSILANGIHFKTNLSKCLMIKNISAIKDESRL